jgi:hypothetical protein
MAKLYGTADPTLVSAAFRHGQSMVPSDTRAIEEWKLKNFEEFTTGVSEAFDKVYADNKKTMDLLTDSADKALTVMETGGMANDYNLGMHNDVVNGFKERLKGIPKGRKGDLDRSKLRSEMNNYLSNIQGGEEMFIGMTQNAANSRLLTDLGDDRAKLFKAILDDHNNGTSLTKPKYEKGDIVYTLPGTNVKMTMRDINEGLSTYDPKYLTGINKMLTDFKAEGKAKGTKWSADDAVRFKNKLQSSITSWDEIRNIGQEKFGKMNYTFEQVLTGQAKDVDGKINTSALEMVYSELEALGSIDVDNDGDIDDTDKSLLAEAKRKGEVYTDSGNGVSLIDILKKDKQKYRDVMANFLTETAVKDFYGQGTAQFKDKKGGKGTGKRGPNQFFLGKQYIPAAAVTPDVNILNEDPKDIPARTAWNNAIFRKVDGQYQIYQDDAFVDVTKEQLRTTLEFSDKVGYDMSGAGTTPKVTAPEVPADFDKAFRNDEKKVVQYFKNNPNLYPGMKVERTTKDDPEDGNDTFRITMPNGTSKVFTADPLTGDKGKIQDAWDWINSNYENNEFAQ